MAFHLEKPNSFINAVFLGKTIVIHPTFKVIISLKNYKDDKIRTAVQIQADIMAAKAWIKFE